MACMLRHITLHLDALRPEVNRQISPDAVAFMNRSVTAWEVGHSSSGTEDIACMRRGVKRRQNEAARTADAARVHGLGISASVDIVCGSHGGPCDPTTQ